MDYQHLKGKEVLCLAGKLGTFSANSKDKALGFVADIDFDIGITIKHIDTQKDLICLNRKDHESVYGHINFYKETFDWDVEQIEKGLLNQEECPRLGTRPSSCAF